MMKFDLADGSTIKIEKGGSVVFLSIARVGGSITVAGTLMPKEAWALSSALERYADQVTNEPRPARDGITGQYTDPAR
jgi:hypothetical protein